MIVINQTENKVFKLFGKKIFEIQSQLNEHNIEDISQIINVTVSKDYYEQEFNLKDKK